MLRLEEHFGHPVLREKDLTELAVIPVNGDRLQDSVILHPRYVPKGFPHKIYTGRIYHTGRTLDIFLEEPIVIDGKEYGILNFKGVGADADRPLVIHPDLWYQQRQLMICNALWISREKGDPHHRVWGAVTSEQGNHEYFNVVLARYGVPHSPYIGINSIPQEIVERIRKVEKGKQKHNLVQLVRAQQTNCRINQHQALSEEQKLAIDSAQLAEIDAQVIKSQYALQEQGHMLQFDGLIEENRLIDGMLTDLENYKVNKQDLGEAAALLTHIVLSSFHLLPMKRHVEYFRELEQKTGLPFTSMLFSGGVIIGTPTVYEIFRDYLRHREFNHIQREMHKRVITADHRLTVLGHNL